jgi:hypothetical protein
MRLEGSSSGAASSPVRRAVEPPSPEFFSDLVHVTVLFHLESLTRANLMGYLGSTVRGALAAACRELTCAYRGSPECRKCSERFGCPYAYIFETPMPPWSERMRSHSEAPRPFVLECGLTEWPLQPGERLSFAMRLFGRAIDHFPLLLAAVRRMAHRGLGREQAPFRLESVHQIGKVANTVWTPTTDTPHPLYVERGLEALQSGPLEVDSLIVHFITPTRIIAGDEVLVRPEFRPLVRSILSRASSISYFHCGTALDLDFRALLELADGVRLCRTRTVRHPFARYSSRQRARLQLDGILGNVMYHGSAVGRFIPLLRMGELLHVGKGTVLGLGRLELEVPPARDRRRRRRGGDR